MKRTTIMLTDDQYAAVLRVAKSRHGGATSPAIRESIMAGIAIVDDAGEPDEGTRLQTYARREAWSEAFLAASASARKIFARALETALATGDIDHG